MKLSRTSIRPEKAQSHRRLRNARMVRVKEIQSMEKGLYFRQRLKWRAQGTRMGMVSSTIPCPSRKEERLGLISKETRAVGKLRRRFFRKGTRMARSPRFQYSITRMLAGCSLGFSKGRSGGVSGLSNRINVSNVRMRRHLSGVIRSRVARATASKVLEPLMLAL